MINKVIRFIFFLIGAYDISYQSLKVYKDKKGGKKLNQTNTNRLSCILDLLVLLLIPEEG